MKVHRIDIHLTPDSSRVLLRPFEPNTEKRTLQIISRVMSLAEADVNSLLDGLFASFSSRHQKLNAFLLERYTHVRRHLREYEGSLSENRKLLIGAYFTQEYALESVALFNPSIVWHPNQFGLADGQRRFILSLRATGEGHISSICFRSGTINEKDEIHLDPPGRLVAAGQVVPDASFDRHLFTRKLREIGIISTVVDDVFGGIGEKFTMRELDEQMGVVWRQYQSNISRKRLFERDRERIMALGQSNYEVDFAVDQSISERILFPTAPTERNGIEDARFVQFTDDGHPRYYATYTAYNGATTVPQFIETVDFLRFKMSTLNGPEVQNKGMALFPRKIRGQFAMLSRQDNENVYLMLSDHPHFWSSKEQIVGPVEPWEFVQMGNCGSPIETEQGWLVLSHGVGPMRQYSISAFLLDLDNPRRVIGRLREPLLVAEGCEREGYVPNVVYSCGALINNESLILPYAASDSTTSFAVASVPEILDCMRH